MYIWEAILEAIKPYYIGHEFGVRGWGFPKLDDLGFQLFDKDGNPLEIGITERVEYLRKITVTDSTVSRRLREFNAGEYDLSSGIVFRWELVNDCWCKIIRLEPFLEITDAITTTNPDKRTTTNVYKPQPEKVSFRPVEGKGGELHLF
jgi:hypothetical protein